MTKNIIKKTIYVFLLINILACPTQAQERDHVVILATSVTMIGSPGIAIARIAQPPASANWQQRANFRGENPSADTRRVADWVVASGDNDGLSFIIVDKIAAMVFVFNRQGQLLGDTSALLGAARGDDSAPGIGDQKLSTITPSERTTPAGRFVAQPGKDIEQNNVLWIDYATSLALHTVVPGSPGEHRMRRLASLSPSDKRITYGCVNVPASFYSDVVQKTFSRSAGIVYILPEVKTIRQVFPAVPPVDNEASGDTVVISSSMSAGNQS